MIKGCLRNENVSAWAFAASINLDQAATRRAVGEAREGWMQAGDHMLVLRGSMNAYVLMPWRA